MTKYHNSVHGPRICKANIKECPIGGQHFETVQDAEKAYQETLKEKFGEFAPLVAKKSNAEKIRQSSYHIADVLDGKIKKVKDSDKAKRIVNELKHVKEEFNYYLENDKKNFADWKQNKTQQFTDLKRGLKLDYENDKASFNEWSQKKFNDFSQKVNLAKVEFNNAADTLDNEIAKAEKFIRTAKAEIKRDAPIYVKSLKHYAKLKAAEVFAEDIEDFQSFKKDAKRYASTVQKRVATKQVGASSLRKHDNYNGYTVLNVNRRRNVVGLTVEDPRGEIKTVKIPADTQITIKRSPARALRNSILPAAKQVLKTPLRNVLHKPSQRQRKDYASYVGVKDMYSKPMSDNVSTISGQVAKLKTAKAHSLRNANIEQNIKDDSNAWTSEPLITF